MKLKIKAMSSESKASAYIIGALPFIVFGLICYINYGYMAPFFTGDPMGLFGLGLMQLVGIGGLCWMSIGAFIMAQMINFRSEEHTSELQSLMRISYAVFCLKKKKSNK